MQSCRSTKLLLRLLNNSGYEGEMWHTNSIIQIVQIVLNKSPHTMLITFEKH